MADDPPKSAKIAVEAFQEALRKLSSPENRENAIKTNATIKDGAIERLIADFEDASQIDVDGSEYWDARDLARLLEYSDYRNFLNIVDKAKEACSTTGIPVDDHFVDATEKVDIGSGGRTRSCNHKAYALCVLSDRSDSRAAIASAIATVRRAMSACMRSTMRPSSWTTPLA